MDTQEIIRKGLSLVHSDPQHNLGPGFRCQLLSSLDKMVGSEGRKLRTKLAVLAVEKVLPLWDAHLPSDHTPHKAIELAEKLLAGSINTLDAQTKINQLWAHCDDLSWKHTDNQKIIMVGYGAIQATREAMSEKHFGCDQMKIDCRDMDVDPYEHDSSFCAVISYSGGPPWESTSDAGKRLEFWTWWLSTAERLAI